MIECIGELNVEACHHKADQDPFLELNPAGDCEVIMIKIEK